MKTEMLTEAHCPDRSFSYIPTSGINMDTQQN